jgi:hypothetical protein
MIYFGSWFELSVRGHLVLHEAQHHGGERMGRAKLVGKKGRKEERERGEKG